MEKLRSSSATCSASYPTDEDLALKADILLSWTLLTSLLSGRCSSTQRRETGGLDQRPLRRGTKRKSLTHRQGQWWRVGEEQDEAKGQLTRFREKGSKETTWCALSRVWAERDIMPCRSCPVAGGEGPHGLSVRNYRTSASSGNKRERCAYQSTRDGTVVHICAQIII